MTLWDNRNCKDLKMSSNNKYCEMEGLVEKTGLDGLVQVISLKSLNSLERYWFQ